MLTLEHVTCSYGPIVAVRDISLQAGDSAIVCVLGPNGAGKSTTLKAIAGLVPPSRGRVRFAGRDITRMEPPERVALGIVLCPEGRRIFPEFTVEENLRIGGYRLSAADLAAGIARAVDLFPRLGERLGQRAAALSGGEQQMLAVARALMSRPRLLLLDEPSLGLAPLVIGQIFERIDAVRREGTTVVLVEQNANMALRVADYAYVLAHGRVALQGPPAGVSALAIERSYLGAAPDGASRRDGP
jgi:branched-chain amino acid transport system ATP-binding protein